MILAFGFTITQKAFWEFPALLPAMPIFLERQDAVWEEQSEAHFSSKSRPSVAL